MKIITIPHPTLRSQAKAVERVDKKLKQFILDLEETLKEKENPKGVGLAAPQVDTKLRIFSTQLNVHPDEDAEPMLRSFINPVITDHSDELIYGPTKKESTLEGCLSIPGLYGPVPRWPRITLTYETIIGDELVRKKESFSDFAARVVQHEVDHLDGVLFIDYTVRYGLLLYKENPKTKDLDELSDDMIAALHSQSQ